MTRFIARRICLALLSLWGVATIIFFMSKLIPGDVARVAAGRLATGEQVEAMREKLHLDQSVLVQYLDFMKRLVHGDFGESVVTHQKVSNDLLNVLPTTVQLVVLTMLIVVAVAAPLGIVAAVNEGRAADIAARLILVLSGGVPMFWLAIMLRWSLSLRLGWFPISGTNSVGLAPPRVTGFTVIDSLLFGNIGNVVDSVAHLLLPAVALSMPFITTLARIIRSNMMTAMKSDFITFAISKGVPRRRIIMRHAFRSSLGAVVTIFGMQFGWMISAAVLVEAVFSLPGIGSYLYGSITSQDTFAVLAAVFVIGSVFIMTALITDMLQRVFDPRVRNAPGGAA
ncbi:ABC transporter permease [Streptomyces yanii]|uniref:ABC transporter permease n=1 Tax=Streptomyces yanii TaxID=78510 RepID=A0ABV5R911_9ACTN